MTERPRHVDPVYEASLEELRTTLEKMGTRVEEMARLAVRSLLEHDAVLAQQVIDSDDEIDAMEVRSDAHCIQVLARHAPVGEDLRLVMCALKVVTDLERVGDLATSIAMSVFQLSSGMDANIALDVERLAERSIGELHKAVQALRQRHSQAASALALEDDLVDELNRRAFERVIATAESEPARLPEMLVLAAVCRHLERIGDHAVNVGEMVVYFLEGRVLRHAKADERLR